MQCIMWGESILILSETAPVSVQPGIGEGSSFNTHPSKATNTVNVEVQDNCLLKLELREQHHLLFTSYVYIS